MKSQSTVTAKMLDIPEEKSRLHLTVNQLSEIKNWKVGKTYPLSLKVKMTGMQEGGWDGKQPLSADFVVVTPNGVKSTEYDGDEDD